MPLDLDCPKCRHVFPVTEARDPVGVQCPACDAELTAEFRRLPLPAPGEPHYELLVSAGRPPGSAPPPAAAQPLRLDEDDGKKRKGGSMLVVVLAGLGALAVTLGGLGGLGYYLFNHLDVPEKTTARPADGGNKGGGAKKDNDPPKTADKTGPRPSEFVSAEWGFRATFPTPPQTRRRQRAGLPVTAFEAEGRDGACVVVVGDDPGIGDNESAARIRARLTQVQDGMVFGPNVKDAKDVKLAGKYPGREFTATVAKPAGGQQRAKIYLVGKRLYQVAATGSAQYVGSPEVQAFLDSFRLAE